MPMGLSSRWARDYPRTSLIALHTAWRLLLLFIALASPGPGYDTSTNLLHAQQNVYGESSDLGWTPAWSSLSKLVRWDSIYFTQIGQRGYLWEQEWAFGWGFTRSLGAIGKVLSYTKHVDIRSQETLAGLIISHASHLLSVLVLHELTLAVYSKATTRKRRQVALLSATLHIISPAGMFLCAPSPESSFSLLNFTGFYLYAVSLTQHPLRSPHLNNCLVVLSGVLLGIATTFRGNGLLSGLVLVYDATTSLIKVMQGIEFARSSQRLVVTCFSGISMACVALVPQYLAYVEYCMILDGQRRPWCIGWTPSIYAWVQKEYWGVGFLRYWTLSNVPLFVLATPMLYVLLRSGMWAWYTRTTLQVSQFEKGRMTTTLTKSDLDIEYTVLHSLALPQLVLATLALTSYHVQIITRLSSGYPVWYWWLASLIIDDHSVLFLNRKWKPAFLITRWMVMYGIVQGGLFASFLPPA